MQYFVRFVLQLLCSVTGYNAILRASTEVRHVKSLVKQLTDLRKMALMIVSFQSYHTRTLSFSPCSIVLGPLSVRRMSRQTPDHL
jgi:hypothetical protein